MQFSCTIEFKVCPSRTQLPLVTHYKICESAQTTNYLTLLWIDDCSACSKAPGKVIRGGQGSGG